MMIADLLKPRSIWSHRIALFLLCVLATGAARGLADDEEKTKTIKGVMRAAMTSGLCKKVAKGDANEDEQEELVSLLETLSEAKPPKGSLDQWKERTQNLLNAAKDVIADKKDARKKLKKSANCAACHKQHKP